MKYHAIVNMDDAIEIARTFRKEGVIWKRKRKGLWWLYDSKSVLGLMYSVTGVEPSMVVSINTWNICDPGQMMIIDAEKAMLPLQRRAKIEIEPSPFLSGDIFWNYRFGIK